MELGGTRSLGGSPGSKAHGFTPCFPACPCAARPGAVLRMQGSKAGLSPCQHKPSSSRQEGGDGESPSAGLRMSQSCLAPEALRSLQSQEHSCGCWPPNPRSVLLFLSPAPSCPTQSSFCSSFPSFFPLWLAGSRVVMVSNAESWLLYFVNEFQAGFGRG